MERVVTINLNGNAYQLDETAFAALRAYLDEADVRLKNNPDRAEILADLEQAIAEKCGRFLGPHKAVVTSAEIEQVIKEMGPVESADDQREGAGSAPSAEPGAQTTARPGPKRLYRIREGAMFMGVCNGLAAYLHIDVVFIRVAFVVAVAVTFGWAWLGYWVLGVIIPEARTADEHAAAHGQAPFNAQEVIDDARRAADSFKAKAESTRREWRRQAREQRRQWRTQARAWRQQWRSAPWTPYVPGAPFGPPAPSMPVPPGVFWPPVWRSPWLPLFGLVGFVGFITLALAVTSLISTGSLWGWPLPDGMPIWVGVLVLAGLFHLLTLPIRAARRAYRYGWSWHYAWLAMWDGVVGFVIVACGVWLLFRHMPPTHNFQEFVRNVPEAIRGAAHEVATWFRNLADRF
jgi:phage shock protein PspC (stress-responsive transcriptional regulator)